MARSAAFYTALKNELTTDPATLGLTVLAADDVANATKLNAISDDFQIDREAIPVSEVFLNIDRDEYVALAAADRDWLRGVSQGTTINPKSGGEVREGILQLFGAQSETRANLVAILTEPANRINYLYKTGVLDSGGNVTPSEVATARNTV